MRGIQSNTTAEIVAEDPCQLRNKANSRRLNKISEDLLARAIAIMKSATQEDCERLELRCSMWHDEKEAVQGFMEQAVNRDNWELVQFGEPHILEKGPQYNPFKPATADSAADSWPYEKHELWRFVNEHVSDWNRHLVKLLNYEDILAAKERRRPKVITGP